MSRDTRFDFIKKIIDQENDKRYDFFLNQLYYQARNNAIRKNKNKIESDDITPVNVSENSFFRELSRGNQTVKDEFNYFKNKVLNQSISINQAEFKKLADFSNNDLSINTFAIAFINKIVTVKKGGNSVNFNNWKTADSFDDKKELKNLLNVNYLIVGEKDTNKEQFSISLDKVTVSRLLKKVSNEGYSQGFFTVDNGSYDFINTLELGKFSNNINENLIDKTKVNSEFKNLTVNQNCYSIGIEVNTDDLKKKCQSFMEQCLLGEDEKKCHSFLLDDLFQKGLKDVETQMKANPMIALKLLKSLGFKGNSYPDGYKQVESYEDWLENLNSRMDEPSINNIKNNSKIKAYLKILIDIVNTSEVANIIEGRIPSRMTGYNYKNKVQIINPFYQPLFMNRLHSAITLYNSGNGNLWANNLKQKYYLGPVLGLKRYQLFQNKPLFLYRPFINYYNSIVVRLNRFNYLLPNNYHHKLVQRFNKLKRIEIELYRLLYYNDAYGNLFEMFPKNNLLNLSTYNQIRNIRIKLLNKVKVEQLYILNQLKRLTNLMNKKNTNIIKYNL